MYIVNGIEYQTKANFLKHEREERKALYRKEFLELSHSRRANLISDRLKIVFDCKRCMEKYKGTTEGKQYKILYKESYNMLLEAFPYFSKAF
jgi:hypothetical protein